jgi:O-antigen/teichoic acid export membrane protein
MGLVSNQSSRAFLAIGLGILLGAINTIFVLPRAFDGMEAKWGVVHVLTAWGMLGAQLVGFGMPAAIVRFLPRFPEKERADILGTMLLIPVTLVVLLCGLLYWHGAPILNWLDAEKGELLSHRIGLFSSMIAVMTVLLLVRATINYRLKSALAVAVEDFWLKGSYLVLALGILFGKISFSTFLQLYLFSWMFGVVILLVQARLNKIKVGFQLRWDRAREILEFCVFGVLNSSAGIINNRIGYIMVGAHIGLSVVPIYTMGFFIGSVVAMPVRATYQILSGITATRIANEPAHMLKGLLKQTSRVQFLLTVSLLVGIHAGFSPFEMILPHNYLGLYPVFFAIGVHRVIVSSQGISNNIIGQSEYFRYSLPINISVIILAIGLNILFLKYLQWGVAGAAMATLCTGAWSCGLRLGLVWFKFKLHPFSWHHLTIVALALLSGWLFQWPAGIFPWPAMGAVIQGALAAGLTLGGAMALGAFPEGLAFIRKKLGQA